MENAVDSPAASTRLPKFKYELIDDVQLAPLRKRIAPDVKLWMPSVTPAT